jgi:curved DNA-binding protein CbpA
MPTIYEILEIPVDANDTVVKKAYRKKPYKCILTKMETPKKQQKPLKLYKKLMRSF